jgi:hypothetical protein
MRDNLGGLVKYYQNNISELEGDIRSDNIDLLRRRSDAAQLTNLRANDIDGLATSLSKIGEKHLIKADEFKLISARGAEDRISAKYKNQLDAKLETLKSDLRMGELKQAWGFKFTFEEYKNALESGQVTYKDGSSKTSKSKKIAESLKNKTDLKTAEPGSDVSINIKDTPDAVYVRNITEMQTLGDKARQANSQVLYEFFNAAKSEYLKNNKDPLRSFGAVKYLNLFGDNWNNIKSYGDFEKALGNSKIKSSAGSLFSEMVRISNTSSNPGGDNAWMKSFIDANPEYIDQAKTSQEAAESYTATMLNTNKKAAEKLVEQTNSNVAKYLLTDNGFIDTEENFYSKVERLKKNNPDYDISNIKYDNLLEEFYKTYNKMGGVALNAGEGLSQESEEAYNIKGYGYKFSTLDPNAKTKEFNNTYETLKTAIEDPETKIVIGDNTEEALGNFDEADNEILKGFLSQLYNKAMTSKKDDSDRPILNGQINTFAANNENLSSLTLSSISNEFLKPYIGTSENPGILYDKDLSKVTVFFNNKKVETPFNLGKGLSDLQIVLKSKGSKKVDVFDDFDVNYTYLDNDKVSVDLDYYEYDLTTGQKVYNNNEPIEVSFDAINDVNSTLIQSLKTTRDNNKAVEIAKYMAKIAKENK